MVDSVDLIMRRSTMRYANSGLREAVLHPNWADDSAPGWSDYNYPQSELNYTNLTGVERQQLMKVLTLLYRKNGFAKAIITLTTGFALGGKVKFNAKNRRVQRVIDDFWNSELNGWDTKLFSRVRDWRLYGEQLWPVFVNPVNGFVRVGYISPAKIKSVKQDDDFPEEIQYVTLYSKDGISSGRKLQVIKPVETMSRDYVNDTEDDFVGEAFFLRANSLSDDSRGYSDLLTMADFFAALDDLVFTSVERSAQQLAWTKHIKVNDTDTISQSLEEEIRRKFNKAKPGSLAVTPDNITVEDIIPNLASADTAQEVATVVNVISGSSNFPNSWLGFGNENNRVTLDKVSGPTLKMLDVVRRELTYHLRTVCHYVIQQAQLRGVIAPSADTEITIELPQIAEEDSREWGRAIAQVTSAAIQAHRNEIITLRTASEMVQRVVSSIGVNYDPDTEIEKRKAEPPSQTDTAGDIPTVGRANVSEPRTEEPEEARNNQ